MLIGYIKKIVKYIFNKAGLNLTKLSSSSSYQIAMALKTYKINIVFDIGANSGQFANDLRQNGYKGKIISFEPLPDAYNKLVKKSCNDRDWIIHPRCAVGNKNGFTEINVSANSASSSILPMLSAHEIAAPYSKYTHKITTTIITLDSILDLYINSNDRLFIKIDTQGYESVVLDGASLAIKKSIGLLLE